MKIDFWEMDLEQLSKTATIGSKLMLTRLAEDGILTQDQYNEYAHNYAIVLIKPTLFSNIWNKLVCKDSRRYILIQNRSMKKSELDDNEPKPGLKVVK